MPVRGAPRGLSPLGNRDFRYLLLGMIAASISYSVSLFALGLLLVGIAVKEGAPERGSLDIGLVGAARGIPGFVFGLAGGVLADRMDRRLLLVGSRLISAVVAVGLALVAFGDQPSLATILVLCVIGASADALDLPLRQAIVPRILPAGELILDRASSRRRSTCSISWCRSSRGF